MAERCGKLGAAWSPRHLLGIGGTRRVSLYRCIPALPLHTQAETETKLNWRIGESPSSFGEGDV
jgi:hypothetical protein